MNTYSDYVDHYFQMPQFIIFLVLAMVLMGIVFFVFYLYAKKTNKTEEKLEHEFYYLSERFYELIFSGGSIIGFMAAYYLINRFVTTGSFKVFWDDYKDYLLLLFMVISILVNSFLDHFVIRIKHLDDEAMASIRLTGMLYMIIIFCYIKFIYEDNNYDMFIAYFLTLMIGRFVYFDASFIDFLKCIKRAAANIPMMIMALAYLGIMCLYGYSNDYLLKHNGVITNIFFTHLFMIVAMFVTHFIAYGIVKKAAGSKSKKAVAGEVSRQKSRLTREERRERREQRTREAEYYEELQMPENIKVRTSRNPRRTRPERVSSTIDMRVKATEEVDISIQDLTDL
ncbi:hypothetical protein SAMN02910298_00065 [Pseudobutyrivibrio sp. YE44]|uniref:hypothetical protein n=1 Tax=Pseudobutyrivibrio sp. YE44 TaxID=1520802 RepID=UPI00088FD2E0|nr:hypothetical protein [Pseudobutyrivibrio sp. YE44]SDB04819.1 hypothetical protein SAMN02910298_00065 [Pseudobutyrivibrio sp. YE44]